MTYRELKKKYMLHEIPKEEYDKGIEQMIERLFDIYEENIIDEKVFKDKLKSLRK